MSKKLIIFGAGPSGAVVARKFAEKNYDVLIYETRNHIAGNMYDYKNEHGIYIQKYGPHIFQCSDNKIINYVKQFSDWYEFRHKVNANINDIEVPLPINFESIDKLFPKSSESLKNKLKKEFKNDVTYILDLLESKDSEINSFAKFIFENVFKNYTIKMWGLKPKEIDMNVLRRVPIRLSYDDGYFSDKFQAIPKEGYTKLIENILDHKNIKVILNSKKDFLQIKNNKTYIDNILIEDPIVWTGPIDQLFNYEENILPYRSLRFEFETIKKDSFQSRSVINYPSHPTMTRITEYKKLTGQSKNKNLKGITTIGKEFPGEFDLNSPDFFEPYYPVILKDNINPAQIYFDKAKKCKNLHILGRLAEYKYKQMWQAINDALNLEI